MTAEETNLRYSLQACANLEREFIVRGDRDSVAHFQLRQRQVQKQLCKICRGHEERQGMAQRCRPTAAPPIADSAILSVCGPERVNVSIGARIYGGAL